jgi:hypothetical protein
MLTGRSKLRSAAREYREPLSLKGATHDTGTYQRDTVARFRRERRSM